MDNKFNSYFAFLGSETDKVPLRIHEWIREGEGEHGQILSPETCLHRVILFSWEMNEILTSSKEPKGGKAPFLQAAERNAAYVARFKLGYFMYIGPG